MPSSRCCLGSRPRGGRGDAGRRVLPRVPPWRQVRPSADSRLLRSAFSSCGVRRPSGRGAGVCLLPALLRHAPSGPARGDGRGARRSAGIQPGFPAWPLRRDRRRDLVFQRRAVVAQRVVCRGHETSGLDSPGLWSVCAGQASALRHSSDPDALERRHDPARECSP